MRSLAAKYNNSNPNDYFSSPRNGFLTGLDSRFSFGKSSGTSPFPGLAPLATTGAAAATTPPTSREEGKSKSADLSLFHQQAASSASAGSQPQSAALLAAAAAANLGHPLGFPLIDMSSTQALINMVRSASAQNASQLENYLKGASNKRGSEPLLATGLGPLDLSSAPPSVSGGKRPRLYAKSEASLLPAEERAKSASVSPKPPPRSGSSSSASSGHSGRCLSLCTDKPCQPESQAVSHWSVDDVCAFVASIDLCAEYVPAFREQAIDGSALPLLTEEHLTSALGLKLGPALKLRAVLARRLGHCALCLHCVHCHGASSTTSAPSPAPSPQQRPAPPPPLQ
ncbi:hypothetical protein B566_EDAN007690 [Ephemera danica]|nr:hypothetical protein B566_EDAN007690 [Ephemera danica]